MNILVLNLGSTSTKAGVFDGAQEICSRTLRHDKAQLSALGGILEQKEVRKVAVLKWLSDEGYALSGMKAIAARGGLIRPIPGGVYLIDEQAARDAASGEYGMHPSNLGMLIAREWSLVAGIPAVFLDAPVTDELSARARVTGVKGITRRSVFHALNAKRVVRLYCAQEGIDPFRHRFVVAHMGGGITVSAVDGLKAVDVNNGVDGEGPFTPERAGGLPIREVLRLLEAFGGDKERLMDALYRQGGLTSHLGSNDVAALCARAGNEPEVRAVLDAMLYGIAKQIGAMAAALEGQVTRILLTGGIAYNRDLMDELTAQVGWIAGCSVFPGEDELAALAEGALRFLSGEEQARRVGDAG